MHKFSSIKNIAIAGTAIALGSFITILPTFAAINETRSKSSTAIAQSTQPKASKIKIEYEVSSDPVKNRYIEYFKQQKGLEYLASVIESKIGNRLPRQIPVYVGDCKGRIDPGNEANAFYESREQYIRLCSEYMQAIEERFKTKIPTFTPDQITTLNQTGIPISANGDLNQSFADSQSLMYGTMLNIFLHESGHMVIDQLKLPVLGREEDAADSFATYVLLKWLPQNGTSYGETLVGSSSLYYLKVSTDEKIEKSIKQQILEQIRRLIVQQKNDTVSQIVSQYFLQNSNVFDKNLEQKIQKELEIGLGADFSSLPVDKKQQKLNQIQLNQSLDETLRGSLGEHSYDDKRMATFLCSLYSEDKGKMLLNTSGNSPIVQALVGRLSRCNQRLYKSGSRSWDSVLFNPQNFPSPRKNVRGRG